MTTDENTLKDLIDLTGRNDSLIGAPGGDSIIGSPGDEPPLALAGVDFAKFPSLEPGAPVEINNEEELAAARKAAASEAAVQSVAQSIAAIVRTLPGPHLGIEALARATIAILSRSEMSPRDYTSAVGAISRAAARGASSAEARLAIRARSQVPEGVKTVPLATPEASSAAEQE